MFKSTIVFCVVLLAKSLSHGFPGSENIESCLAKTGASRSDLAPPFVVPQTEAAACLMGCMHMKSGIMNADFSFNLQKAQEMMGNHHIAQEMKSVFEFCINSVGTSSSDCEAAKKLATCLSSKIAKEGIIIPPFPKQ